MAASTLSWSCRRVLGFLSRNLHQSSVSTSRSISLQTQFDRNSPSKCPGNSPILSYSSDTVFSRPQFAHKIQLNGFHTSKPTHHLMEFFDRKEVWGLPSVQCGRPWRLDELRLKSNVDLHKLWYVLLKERNMLLTMEAEYNRQQELFPNPERIEKVEESMENILEVIKERDNAVSMLETGVPADKGGYYIRDFLGRIVYRKRREYAIPPHMNKVFRLTYPRVFKKQHLKYLALYREKLAKRRYYAYIRKKQENQKLIEKFPHLEGKLEEPTFKEPSIS